MATISRFSAVASIGPLQFGGFLAWLLWLGVHLVYIIGFKHRVTTLLHWAISFLGRGRAERDDHRAAGLRPSRHPAPRPERAARPAPTTSGLSGRAADARGIPDRHAPSGP